MLHIENAKYANFDDKNAYALPRKIMELTGLPKFITEYPGTQIIVLNLDQNLLLTQVAITVTKDDNHWFIIFDYNYKHINTNKFKLDLNKAVNDEYNGKIYMELNECDGHNYEHYALFAKIENRDVASVFEKLKVYLLSISSTIFRISKFSLMLDKLFNMLTIQKISLIATANNLFAEQKYDEAYDIVVPLCTLPCYKSVMLNLGTQLESLGELSQSIKFLNSEPMYHKETWLLAQRKLFDVLGDILCMDDRESFLSEDEIRNYKRNRIELAIALKDTYPELNEIINKLFNDYCDNPTVGEEAKFNIVVTDLLPLIFDLANELYNLKNKN